MNETDITDGILDEISACVCNINQLKIRINNMFGSQQFSIQAFRNLTTAIKNRLQPVWTRHLSQDKPQQKMNGNIANKHFKSFLVVS